jgi:hypothetical protein
MECDCLVGFLSGEKVLISTIEGEVARIVELQPLLKKVGILNGEPQNRKQILDGRKGYLSRYKYCPYCGVKIDWKKIIN